MFALAANGSSSQFNQRRGVLKPITLLRSRPHDARRQARAALERSWRGRASLPKAKAGAVPCKREPLQARSIRIKATDSDAVVPRRPRKLYTAGTTSSLGPQVPARFQCDYGSKTLLSTHHIDKYRNRSLCAKNRQSHGVIDLAPWRRCSHGVIDRLIHKFGGYPFRLYISQR